MAKKRRGRGEGTIVKRKDGLWCGALSGPIGSDGKRRRSWVYGTSAGAVQDELARLRLRPSNAGPADPKQTVSNYLLSWLDSARPTIRRATYLIYERAIRLHLAPGIGSVKLPKLGSAHVQSMLSGLERDGTSPRTRQIALGVLKHSLRQAVRWGLIAANPCDAVDRPKAPHKPIRSLTLEESRALLEAARNDRLHALYVLAVTTGMRQGELLGLQWKDVDLDARALSVRHQLAQDDQANLILTEPKTAAGRRRIELSQVAITALREQQRRLLAEGLRASPWVFPDTRGGPMRKDNLVHRSFSPLLKRAGLPHIRFHDLRHTAATLMLLQGVHAKVVQERLGHSKIGLTLDTYSHVLPSMQRDAADRLDRMFLASDSA